MGYSLPNQRAATRSLRDHSDQVPRSLLAAMDFNKAIYLSSYRLS